MSTLRTSCITENLDLVTGAGSGHGVVTVVLQISVRANQTVIGRGARTRVTCGVTAWKTRNKRFGR